MRLGVRGKLFVVSLILISAVGLASGVYVEGGLREELEDAIERTLERHATVSREAVESADLERGVSGDWVDAYDALADRLGEATAARVTIIAGDGRVLGDSSLDPGGVRALENHAMRPEVVAALSQRVGRSRRYSATLGADMTYVAAAFARSDTGGVVRVAMPLSEVDTALSRLRVFFIFAGIFGLGVAIFMSGLASHLLSRTLRSLADNAKALAAEGRGRRLPVPSSDEIGGLAGSFNAMAEEIDRAMSELALERDRMGAVLESMGEGVLLVNPERRVTMANPAVQRLLGLSYSPVGRALVEVLRVPSVHRLLRRLSREETPRTLSAEFELAVPEQRTFLMRATPLRSSAGTVLVLHDVTQIRRAELMRRDFVANVSHELRTPITVMRAAAETLLDGALDHPKHARRFVESLSRNAERLGLLINDLLDLAKLESGRYRLSSEEIDVSRAIHNVVRSVDALLQNKSITLETECPAGLVINADANALEQILVNLVGNAVKYSPELTTIRVVARKSGDKVRIAVEDEGPGVAPKHEARLFERFFRVDAGRSRDAGGTGLGLAIVKHLSDAMGGAVGYTPRQPKGSIFWVVLPQEPPEELDAMELEAAPDRQIALDF